MNRLERRLVNIQRRYGCTQAEALYILDGEMDQEKRESRNQAEYERQMRLICGTDDRHIGPP